MNELTLTNQDNQDNGSVVERDGQLVYISENGVEYPRPGNNWTHTFTTYNAMCYFNDDAHCGESVYASFGGQRIHFFSYEQGTLLRTEIYNYSTNSWNHLSTMIVDTDNGESVADTILQSKIMIRAMQLICSERQAYREEIGEMMTNK